MIQVREPDDVDKKEYPLFITAEEKDKVLTTLLVKANGAETVVLEYNDVYNLEISKKQFETVINEFKANGLIESVGYGTEYTLLFKIHDRRDKLGFYAEKEMYINNVNTLALQLTTLESSASDAAMKILDQRIERAKNIGELVLALKGFADFF